MSTSTAFLTGAACTFMMAADDSAIYVILVVAPTRSGGREAEACLRCPARRRACGGAVRRAYRIVYSTTAIISISTIASG
jgi:hypothetical protein